MAQGYYVTGTDTAVGKTLASVALLHALRARGLRAVGMKPVASGCTLTPEGWRNEDALALQAASLPTTPYDKLNPYALPAATAPQIAAALAGVEVTLPPMLGAYGSIAANADAVVVEGVGGWMAPLAHGLEQSQLVAALRLPVILVVGLRLGCLNHARLSERAIVADGHQLAGWIGSQPAPEFEFADEYIALLHASLQAPCLGLLPYSDCPDPSRLAGNLRFPNLG